MSSVNEVETLVDALGNVHKKDKLCPNCGKLVFCVYSGGNCGYCRPKPGEKGYSGNYTGTLLHNLKLKEKEKAGK